MVLYRVQANTAISCHRSLSLYCEGDTLAWEAVSDDIAVTLQVVHDHLQ